MRFMDVYTKRQFQIIYAEDVESEAQVELERCVTKHAGLRVDFQSTATVMTLSVVDEEAVDIEMDQTGSHCSQMGAVGSEKTIEENGMNALAEMDMDS